MHVQPGVCLRKHFTTASHELILAVSPIAMTEREFSPLTDRPGAAGETNLTI